MFRRRAVLGALFTVLAVGSPTPLAQSTTPVGLAPKPGSILAPVRYQAGWLSLDAPRPRLLTRFETPSYVSDLAVSSTGVAAIAVQSIIPGQARFGGDLLLLNPGSGETTPLVTRADTTESLGAPAWQPDGASLVYQRDDLRSPPMSYLGQASVRYPSRLEVVSADGSNRSVFLDDARQPTLSPSGAQLAFVRSTHAGTALLIRGQSTTADERELVPAGRFTDVAYPRFSPRGDQVAFVAIGAVAAHENLLDALFGSAVAYAHGLPFDVWLVGADGTGLRQLAAVGADDPSVTWSPDGTQIFVYGGSGSFIVDAATGEVAAFPFVAGYGATAWIS